MTIERTVKLATIVDTIEEAFAFVIEHIDAEGMTAPSVHIGPVWVTPANGWHDLILRYEVSVSDMKEGDG